MNARRLGAIASRARRTFAAAALACCGVLAGCDKPAAPPAPPPAVEISGNVSYEATGYYCGMLLAEHAGPKGQIHLARRDRPLLWFSSVRDTIAFTRLPEEPREISAIYVNDMGRVRNWQQPEAGTWIDARTAWYVIESDRRGGMGAPEAIPFSDRSAADAFRTAHGGRVLRLEEIPDAYVLGPVDLAPAAADAAGSKHDADHAPNHASGHPPAPSANAAAASGAPES